MLWNSSLVVMLSINKNVLKIIMSYLSRETKILRELILFQSLTVVTEYFHNCTFPILLAEQLICL